MISDLVGLIANIALALSFVIGLIFGIAQVRAAARDRRERLTLETLRNFQSHEFAELIFYLTFRDIPSSREELQARPVWLIPLSQVRPYLVAARSRQHDFGPRFARCASHPVAFRLPSFCDVALA